MTGLFVYKIIAYSESYILKSELTQYIQIFLFIHNALVFKQKSNYN